MTSVLHEGEQDPTKNPHFGVLCILLANTLSKGRPAMAEAIEDAAAEVLRFFSEADSGDRNWSAGNNMQSQDADTSIFSKPGRAFESVFSLTHDGVERAACTAARQGNFQPLEALISTRGYLRTSEAREIVLARMQSSERKKLPQDQRLPSRHHLEYLDEVTNLMLKHLCSLSEARKRLIELRLDLKLDTLKSAIDRIFDNHPGLEIQLRITECFVDVQRSEKGLPPIFSRDPRGREALLNLIKLHSKPSD